MSGLTFTLPPLPDLRTTDFFGATIKYYDVGSGPPMLLVHGLGGSADDWAFCLDAFAASHRVIAPDLLGFGRSDKPYIDYTIAGFVEMLKRFLRTLGIERAAMVGLSLGGWIAAAFALAFPHAIDKLVLVDSAGIWAEMTELPIDLHVSTLAHLREVYRYLFYDKSLACDDLIELSYQLHLERGDGRTIQSLLANLCDGRERLDERIASLSVPTLIVWGEQDELFPVEIARRIHAQVEGSQLEIFPRCGHMPNMEKTADFVRRVLEFVG